MSGGKNGKVSRRRVFYVPGYDPFPPRRYRELYRTESDAQAKISGYEIAVQGRTGTGLYGWHVDARIDGQKVATDFDVLVWSDIVQTSMRAGIPATYLQLLRTAWIYIATGTLRRLMWLPKGPILAAFYPIGMLLVQLAIAVALAWAVAVSVSHALYPGIGWISALPVFAMVLHWFRQQDRKLFAYYLMHDFAFTVQRRGATPVVLENRMAEFATAIEKALYSDVDEVLVVGHSSGAHVAVSVLADLIRSGRVPPEAPVLSFLSLGQVIPMVSFLPEAHKLRADLHFLAQSDRLSWFDVTAPGDGCSFALCDPVSVSGVAPENKRWPIVFSAAFSKSLSAKRLKSLRRRFFRLHFQYLCAFDRPRDYDYFQITAGPMTLGTRYRERYPSKGRIDVAASRYTSMSS